MKAGKALYERTNAKSVDRTPRDFSGVKVKDKAVQRGTEAKIKFKK